MHFLCKILWGLELSQEIWYQDIRIRIRISGYLISGYQDIWYQDIRISDIRISGYPDKKECISFAKKLWGLELSQDACHLHVAQTFSISSNFVEMRGGRLTSNLWEQIKHNFTSEIKTRIFFKNKDLISENITKSDYSAFILLRIWKLWIPPWHDLQMTETFCR